MDKPLYQFINSDGDFISETAHLDNGLYFPLANEAGLLSAITPRLAGDIKLDQHSFLTLPASIEDLHRPPCPREVWLTIQTGSSTIHRPVSQGWSSVQLEAGLLWQKIVRGDSSLGLEVSTLNFIPADGGTVEIMMVEIMNRSKKKRTVTPTTAFPIFARSADNLRDHRHVTSLLNRITRDDFGLTVTPTMAFNEKGHHLNHRSYCVGGVDEKGRGPAGFFPTWESFIGRGGDFERPAAIFDDLDPSTEIRASHQGKEAMGALRFAPITLEAGRSSTLIFFLGANLNAAGADEWVKTYGDPKKIEAALQKTKSVWKEKAEKIIFKTGDEDFDRWIRWVGIQPTLRKMFGCSFLPDFDYGRGGRGWRDLWQDCLALLLANPDDVRPMLLANFEGVRFDGSNATIIGRKELDPDEPEFIADRNNITRTWMDHGVWPYLTTELYVHQTGDWDLLLQERLYFRDAQLRRGRKLDLTWDNDTVLKAKNGKDVRGSILEHILVQHLVPFFNVGDHGLIRLEDADWNDGLDMARDKGESVAFTSLYAGNLASIADFLELAKERKGWKDVTLTAELTMLLDLSGARLNYSIEGKRDRLHEYFDVLEKGLSGNRASVPIYTLVHDLREKSASLANIINQQEWLEAEGCGWFNGYYDNRGQKVEGPSLPAEALAKAGVRGSEGTVNMTLTGQVYPIMSGVADEARVRQTICAVNEHLWDHDLQGIRLNTDFGGDQPDLGRAFSFAYGEKENGAVFSHMVVMYANALYKRGFSDEGYRALDSLYRLSKNSSRSRIFPGLPEYFDNEGRGRYATLTGSASWMMLTLLTRAFGVRGRSGDLVLAPQLAPDQFDKKGEASVQFFFAGKRITVTYKNKNKKPPSDCKIEGVFSGKNDVVFSRLGPASVLIQREILKQRDVWKIEVNLD